MGKYTLIGPAEPLDPSKRRSKYSLIPNEQPIANQQENQPSFMNRVEGFNNFMGRYAAPIAAGVFQAPLDSAWLVNNLLRGSVGAQQVPRTNLSEYLQPGHSEFGKTLGEFASLAPLGLNIARAGASKLGSTELAKKLGNVLSSEKMGTTMLNKYKDALQGSRREFGNVFEEATKHNAPSVQLKIPKSDLGKLNKAVGKESIEEFMSNPTTESAHFLRSALKKYEEGIKKLGHASHPSDRPLAKTAGEYAKKLGKSLTESLGKAKETLPEAYSKARVNYKTNVTPYQNVRGNYFGKASLKPGEKGYIYPERLPGKVARESGDPVRAALERDIPEYKYYEMLRSPGSKLAAKGAIGLGAGTAIKKLFFD